ncbi:MAG: Tryptophan synthase alpha chain [Proteobacteria bacterium]|nr:Tryptophan synthase alpha chain [Pseudomonadota bacterium]
MRRQQAVLRTWVLAATLLVPAAESAAADCRLDTSPACSTAISLGATPGDTGTQSLVRTGTGEAHFLVTVREESSSTRALVASVVLAVPPDVDYDLIVRCSSCNSPNLRSTKSPAGTTERIIVRRSDTFGDQTFTIAIEIRYSSGKSCAPWTLSVSGNTSVSTTDALSCG